MTDKATILSEIKKAVWEADPSADVILFGSRARGDFHDESDWDVLVVTDQEPNPDYKRMVRQKLFDIQLERCISVGSLFVNRRKWQQPSAMPVYLEIKKDGILL